MRAVLFRMAPPVVAFLGGITAGLPVFVLGLVFPELLVGPLALAFGALVCALGAGWMGNLFSPDRSRTSLLHVVAVTEVAAVLVAPVTFLVLATPLGPLVFARGIFVLVLPMFIVAAVATVATWRFRGAGPEPGKALALTVALVVLGAVALVAILYLVAWLAP
ncbi:MAG: hypothetical protein ABR592_09100 [Nitriliruptorales bacterium]